MARKKGPHVDAAYQYIKDRILTFEFAPGSEISDHKLEQNLGMSRSPIHEATLQLMADGLIDKINGKLIVSPVNLKDIIEICQVRRSIEISALEIIRDHGGLTKEKTAQLESLLKKMTQSDDIMENYRLDDQFHSLLMEAAGNSRMIDISNKMRLQIFRARWLTVMTPHRLPEANKEHAKIVETLKENDFPKCLEAMSEHLSNSEKNFEYVLTRPSLNSQLLRGMATLVSCDTTDGTDYSR